jgi:hypothetical protein
MGEFYWALALGGVGVVLGMFFVLNGFAEPTGLKRGARMENLFWLGIGAFLVATGDWWHFGSNAPNAGLLLASYLLGGVAGIIFALLTIVSFLALSIRQANRLRGGIEPVPYSLLVDYLHHGYAHYQQMRAKHDEARPVRQAQADQ